MPFTPAQRSAEIEWMDSGDYTPDEIRSNLADLRFFNAWTGGTRVMRREVADLIGSMETRRPVTLLDIATGSADIPSAVGRALRRRGVPVIGLACDANADVIAEARRSRGGREVRLVRAEAAHLPHAAASIDVVICSNFLHHLGDMAAREALAEMRRVARRGVVVCDLTRSRRALRLVWIATRVTTFNRLTRHDGPLSVARAFTPEEMRRIAEDAGLHGARVRRSGPVRMVLRWDRNGPG